MCRSSLGSGGSLAPEGARPSRSTSMRSAAPWLLCLFFAAFLPTPAKGQAGPPEPVVSDTVFRAATPVLAEVGYLDVPENRERLGSGKIRIRFLRFESLTADPGPPVFWLSGGPGTSGTVTARYQAFPLMMALRAVSDVVVIDQRGTSGSTPDLRCPDRWSYPLGTIGSWNGLVDSYRKAVARCAAYWRDRGVDLAAYHTSANADDIEELREALGYPQIHLFGVSYGTHLGLDFIRRHPESVRRAVFAGVHGLDQTIGLPTAADRQLQKIESLFQENMAATTQLPSVTSTLRSVIQRLRETPTVVRREAADGDSVTVAVGAFDLQLAVSQRLAHRNSVTQWLVRTLRDANTGDLTRVVRTVAGDRSRRINAMGLAMGCASGVSASRLEQIEQEAETSLLGRAPAFPMMELCAAIPHQDLGPDFREPVRSDIPILFVSGTLDHDAVRTVRSFQGALGNAGHLILENGFHNDYIDFWPVYVGYVTSFLAGNRVEEEVVHLPISFEF